MGFGTEPHRLGREVLRDGLTHCGLGLFVGFVNSKKNTKEHQPYHLSKNCINGVSKTLTLLTGTEFMKFKTNFKIKFKTQI